MSATVHEPAEFYQGNDWEIEGTLAYADGTPFDLSSGATVQWRLANSAGAVVLDYALGSGIAVLDATAAKVLIRVDEITSAALAAGPYVDELRASDPSGFTSTQWRGRVDVKTSLFVP
jgi:hypothetical protein